MPLSRHLYSLDEVQAALLYSAGRCMPTETVFWAKELILSGCASEAISILFQSWLWSSCAGRGEWLINAWNTLASNELSEDSILLAAGALASICPADRDTSLWNILVLTSQNPNQMPDTITRKVPQGISTHDEKEFYFVCAVHQGKARAAWWVAQYIPQERVWKLLEELCSSKDAKYTVCLKALRGYEQLLGYTSTAYDTITQAAAVVIASTNNLQSFRPLPDKISIESAAMLEDFARSEGRRSARLFKIPKECLYGTTVRGRSPWTKNNLKNLHYNIEEQLIGCPFWDEVLQDYASVHDVKIIWNSCEKKEEFYDKYFPDDIPDEWSRDDQLKSHGDGILRPKEKPTIWKYSRLYLVGSPRYAWNTNSAVHKYLEKMDISDCSIEQLIENSNKISELPVELVKLKPVHKIKIT